MKLYVVIAGCIDDYSLDSVWSTEEQAEERKYDIEHDKFHVPAYVDEYEPDKIKEW